MKRIIFVNDISEVEYQNIGVHFTESNQYIHTGGGSNGCTEVKRFQVEISVSEANINESATAISRAEFPKEKEVVLEKNQEIVAEVRIIDTETRKIIGGYPGIKKMIVNTGTRCDQWVDNVK